MTTILVLCGLPGTGKSTYAKNYLKRLGADSEKMLKELEEYNRIQEMVNQQNLRN
jgi:predicted kinase